MITLDPFKSRDAHAVCSRIYPEMTVEQARGLIREWSSGQYNGKVFQVLGIWDDAQLVGYVSLLETDEKTVSFGIEVCPDCRRRGYGFAAGQLARDFAEKLATQS